MRIQYASTTNFTSMNSSRYKSTNVVHANLDANHINRLKVELTLHFNILSFQIYNFHLEERLFSFYYINEFQEEIPFLIKTI